MSYEIITPDGKNLYLRIHLDTQDTKENRIIVHQIRELVEKMTPSSSELKGKKTDEKNKWKKSN